MKSLDKIPSLIKTIKEKCKVCYSCVRGCLPSAIRVEGGKVEIIDERCISCGNCIRVCSQNANEHSRSIHDVVSCLNSKEKVAVCIDSSFPIEFYDYDYKYLVGTLRALGFDYVVDAGFGADLVARQYKKLYEESHKHYISTYCPAVVSYVEKYHPALVKYLAPIVSPMIASAKIIRKKYGGNSKIIYVGPCVAKKEEALKYHDSVDAVLTFKELQELFELLKVQDLHIQPDEFDPPLPEKGMLFPMAGGLLQSANLSIDLFDNNIIMAYGKNDIIQFIKELYQKEINPKLMDLLCCDGCIMGPGFSANDPKYRRQKRLSEFIKPRYEKYARANQNLFLGDYLQIDLSTRFKKNDKRLETPTKEVLVKILKRTRKDRKEDQLNCGVCGYETCQEHAIAIHKGLAERDMCLPYLIEKYKKTAEKLTSSYKLLEDTQQELIQAEKMASMGQVSAGIAHEINNPLGIIVLYANLLLDDSTDESKSVDDIKMIAEQADRCKTIISRLLNFARKNKVILKETNINASIQRCLQVIRVPDDIFIDFKNKSAVIMAEVDPDQIMQVFINLISNAIEALPYGGSVSICVTPKENSIEIDFCDTGIGIKKDTMDKIFEPFFTTRQIGKGTGLGLAVTYGIVKMHKGNIGVISNADPNICPTGTTFTVTLPVKSMDSATNKVLSL